MNLEYYHRKSVTVLTYYRSVSSKREIAIQTMTVMMGYIAFNEELTTQ